MRKMSRRTGRQTKQHKPYIYKADRQTLTVRLGIIMKRIKRRGRKVR